MVPGSGPVVHTGEMSSVIPVGDSSYLLGGEEALAGSGLDGNVELGETEDSVSRR